MVAEVASTIGALFLIAGMMGVMRLMRGPRVTLGQLATGVVIVGLIGLTGSIAFSVFDLAMAAFEDRGAMVELRSELQDSGPFRAFWLSFSAIGTVGGLILLSIALFRRSFVPRWAPAAICAAALVWYAGGSEPVLYVTSWLLLAIGLAPLAARIWSLDDDAWARWDAQLESRAGGGSSS
jgi:hypothetical protein